MVDRNGKRCQSGQGAGGSRGQSRPAGFANRARIGPPAFPPGRHAELPLPGLDDAEFTRLVRRALSHYGDLPRLAASPLTRLAIADERLTARGAPDHPLERAAELKALLAESIGRLKPRDRGDFGTTDEWRHYNALYFPYVAELKPYSRRATADGLDPTALAAPEWFGAARLVARDLRARETMDDGR